MLKKYNKRKNNCDKNKAFTLIELLVVIAIIGILSTIVLTSLSSAREKARDAKKGVVAKQWINALELYYYDNNSYPDSSATGTSYSCLGDGYEDPGNGTYLCLGINGRENSALNTEMSEYYPSLPVTDETMPISGGYDYKGIGYASCDGSFSCNTGTVSDPEYEIRWYLEVDTATDVGNCPIGVWVSSTPKDYCRYNI